LTCLVKKIFKPYIKAIKVIILIDKVRRALVIHYYHCGVLVLQ